MEKSTFENKRKINDLEFEIEKFKALENKEKQEIRVFRINEIENMRNLHEKVRLLRIQAFKKKFFSFIRKFKTFKPKSLIFKEKKIIS
jgi:phosphoribosylanthranilate isomerase